MRQIKAINKNNKEILLSHTAPFILQNFEFKTGVNVNNSKSMNQDGATYNSNTLDVSEVTMQITVTSKSIDDLKENKRLIYEIFNPKIGEVTLINENKKLDCIVTEIPFFAPQSQRDEICLISLIAHNPFWQDSEVKSVEIVSWIGGLTFPLRLPTTFALAGEESINVINSGDVDTPMQIEIRGKATKPMIQNTRTGEFIKINRTLIEGDTLIITTEFGKKRVEQNGISVFNYIDIDSTFFDLRVGDNIITMTTDDLDDEASVKITYSNRYLGV